MILANGNYATVSREHRPIYQLVKVVLLKAGAGDEIVVFVMINTFSCDINFCRKTPFKLASGDKLGVVITH